MQAKFIYYSIMQTMEMVEVTYESTIFQSWLYEDYFLFSVDKFLDSLEVSKIFKNSFWKKIALFHRKKNILRYFDFVIKWTKCFVVNMKTYFGKIYSQSRSILHYIRGEFSSKGLVLVQYFCKIISMLRGNVILNYYVKKDQPIFLEHDYTF